MKHLLLIPLIFSILTQNSKGQNTCNFAGTIEVEQFIGQSTQHQLDTIILCFGDSVLIRHHGDADLSGDPNPATPAGITFPFYLCSPSISGATFLEILGDPCLAPGSASGIFTTPSVPNGGDTWFYNTGDIQNIFNVGQPTLIDFAPATIDNYLFNGYESAVVGTPPGPCVNVNLDEAFSVIYLNEIKATGISTNFVDDCLGKFRVSGGYPEFDQTAHYTIDISLASDPTVKALMVSSPDHFLHLSNIVFSVPQTGVYNVSVADKTGCGKQFQMNMATCDASDNLLLDIGEATAAVGEEVCLPVTVENFDIVVANFSINWDSTLLKFKDIKDLNPAISFFFNLDTFAVLDRVNQGQLGIFVYDSWFSDPIHIPDGASLFSLCFEVLDTNSENCIPVWVSNDPIGVQANNDTGLIMSVSVLPGGVCKTIGIKEKPAEEGSWEIYPNPAAAGKEFFLKMPEAWAGDLQINLLNALGQRIFSKKLQQISQGNILRLPLESVEPGLYFVELDAGKENHKMLKLSIL